VQLAVVGPNFRQSKLVIRKINAFIQQKLPVPYREILVGRKPLETKVSLINGSIIEAYPCNPDTMRGPTLDGALATEFNFVRDDELYDTILFTLGTTNGFFTFCEFTVHWHDNYQNFFAALSLQPNMAALSPHNSETDLSQNFDYFAAGGGWKLAQARPTLTTVTSGR
jgi:hypothetical protein